MKIIKYILFASIVVALWITAPLWMPRSDYGHNASISEVDAYVSQQENKRNTLLKAQDKKLAKIESKFGRKSSIMTSLKAYWAKTYTKSDSFELSKCYNIQEGMNGWTIHCTYRVKGNITQSTYTINNGQVSQ